MFSKIPLAFLKKEISNYSCIQTGISACDVFDVRVGGYVGVTCYLVRLSAFTQFCGSSYSFKDQGTMEQDQGTDEQDQGQILGTETISTVFMKEE